MVHLTSWFERIGDYWQSIVIIYYHDIFVVLAGGYRELSCFISEDFLVKSGGEGSVVMILVGKMLLVGSFFVNISFFIAVWGWPLVVAIHLGSYFCTASTVSPFHVPKLLFLIFFIQVNRKWKFSCLLFCYVLPICIWFYLI